MDFKGVGQFMATGAGGRLEDFVPELIVRYVGACANHGTAIHEPPFSQDMDVVAMFVDISGFTKLSETLAQRGGVGAEKLAFYLNRYFEQLSRIVTKNAGDVFKFAGDALLAIWWQSEDQPNSEDALAPDQDNDIFDFARDDPATSGGITDQSYDDQSNHGFSQKLNVSGHTRTGRNSSQKMSMQGNKSSDSNSMQKLSSNQLNISATSTVPSRVDRISTDLTALSPTSTIHSGEPLRYSDVPNDTLPRHHSTIASDSSPILTRSHIRARSVSLAGDGLPDGPYQGAIGLEAAATMHNDDIVLSPQIRSRRLRAATLGSVSTHLPNISATAADVSGTHDDISTHKDIQPLYESTQSNANGSANSMIHSTLSSSQPTRSSTGQTIQKHDSNNKKFSHDSHDSGEGYGNFQAKHRMSRGLSDVSETRSMRVRRRHAKKRDLTIPCRRAILAAIAIQEELDAANLADNVTFSVKLGIGVGRMSLLFMGGVFGRVEYLANGPALKQAFQCEKDCSSGELVVSNEVWKLINPLKLYRGQKMTSDNVKIDLSVTGTSAIQQEMIMTESMKSSKQYPATPSAAMLRHRELSAGRTSHRRIRSMDVTNDIVNSSNSTSTANRFVSLAKRRISSLFGNGKSMNSTRVISDPTSPDKRISQDRLLEDAKGTDPLLKHIHGNDLVSGQSLFPTTLRLRARNLKRTTLDSPALLRTFVPAAIVPHISSATAAWASELRTISVVFVNLGIPPESLHAASDDSVSHMHAAVRVVQAAIYEYEGSLNKYSIDDKGSTVLACFGLPPLSHENDPERAVLAALRVSHELRIMGLSPSIGVTTGVVFAGPLGAGNRREYSVIGDVVNTSARLMQLSAKLLTWLPPPNKNGPHGDSFDMHNDLTGLSTPNNSIASRRGSGAGIFQISTSTATPQTTVLSPPTKFEESKSNTDTNKRKTSKAKMRGLSLNVPTTPERDCRSDSGDDIVTRIVQSTGTVHNDETSHKDTMTSYRNNIVIQASDSGRTTNSQHMPTALRDERTSRASAIMSPATSSNSSSAMPYSANPTLAADVFQHCILIDSATKESAEDNPSLIWHRLKSVYLKGKKEKIAIWQPASVPQPRVLYPILWTHAHSDDALIAEAFQGLDDELIQRIVGCLQADVLQDMDHNSTEHISSARSLNTNTARLVNSARSLDSHIVHPTSNTTDSDTIYPVKNNTQLHSTKNGGVHDLQKKKTTAQNRDTRNKDYSVVPNSSSETIEGTSETIPTIQSSMTKMSTEDDTMNTVRTPPSPMANSTDEHTTSVTSAAKSTTDSSLVQDHLSESDARSLSTSRLKQTKPSSMASLFKNRHNSTNIETQNKDTKTFNYTQNESKSDSPTDDTRQNLSTDALRMTTVVVLGDAGAGKTRLLRRIIRSLNSIPGAQLAVPQIDLDKVVAACDVWQMSTGIHAAGISPTNVLDSEEGGISARLVDEALREVAQSPSVFADTFEIVSLAQQWCDHVVRQISQATENKNSTPQHQDSVLNAMETQISTDIEYVGNARLRSVTEEQGDDRWRHSSSSSYGTSNQSAHRDTSCESITDKMTAFASSDTSTNGRSNHDTEVFDTTPPPNCVQLNLWKHLQHMKSQIRKIIDDVEPVLFGSSRQQLLKMQRTRQRKQAKEPSDTIFRVVSCSSKTSRASRLSQPTSESIITTTSSLDIPQDSISNISRHDLPPLATSHKASEQSRQRSMSDTKDRKSISHTSGKSVIRTTTSEKERKISNSLHSIGHDMTEQNGSSETPFNQDDNDTGFPEPFSLSDPGWWDALHIQYPPKLIGQIATLKKTMAEFRGDKNQTLDDVWKKPIYSVDMLSQRCQTCTFGVDIVYALGVAFPEERRCFIARQIVHQIAHSLLIPFNTSHGILKTDTGAPTYAATELFSSVLEQNCNHRNWNNTKHKSKSQSMPKANSTLKGQKLNGTNAKISFSHLSSSEKFGIQNSICPSLVCLLACLFSTIRRYGLFTSLDTIQKQNDLPVFPSTSSEDETIISSHFDKENYTEEPLEDDEKRSLEAAILAELIKLHASHKPLAILVDKAYLASAQDWALLESIAALIERYPSLPCQLIIATRPIHEPRFKPAFGGVPPAYFRMYSRLGVEVFDLQPWTEEHTADMLETLLDAPKTSFPSKLIPLVRGMAGGNPRFTQKFVHGLLKTGLLSVEALYVQDTLNNLKSQIPTHIPSNRSTDSRAVNHTNDGLSSDLLTKQSSTSTYSQASHSIRGRGNSSNSSRINSLTTNPGDSNNKLSLRSGQSPATERPMKKDTYKSNQLVAQPSSIRLNLNSTLFLPVPYRVTRHYATIFDRVDQTATPQCTLVLKVGAALCLGAGLTGVAFDYQLLRGVLDSVGFFGDAKIIDGCLHQLMDYGLLKEEHWILVQSPPQNGKSTLNYPIGNSVSTQIGYTSSKNSIASTTGRHSRLFNSNESVNNSFSRQSSANIHISAAATDYEAYIGKPSFLMKPNHHGTHGNQNNHDSHGTHGTHGTGTGERFGLPSNWISNDDPSHIESSFTDTTTKTHTDTKKSDNGDETGENSSSIVNQRNNLDIDCMETQRLYRALVFTSGFVRDVMYHRTLQAHRRRIHKQAAEYIGHDYLKQQQIHYEPFGSHLEALKMLYRHTALSGAKDDAEKLYTKHLSQEISKNTVHHPQRAMTYKHRSLRPIKPSATSTTEHIQSPDDDLPISDTLTSRNQHGRITSSSIVSDVRALPLHGSYDSASIHSNDDDDDHNNNNDVAFEKDVSNNHESASIASPPHPLHESEQDQIKDSNSAVFSDAVSVSTHDSATASTTSFAAKLQQTPQTYDHNGTTIRGTGNGTQWTHIPQQQLYNHGPNTGNGTQWTQQEELHVQHTAPPHAIYINQHRRRRHSYGSVYPSSMIHTKNNMDTHTISHSMSRNRSYSQPHVKNMRNTAIQPRLEVLYSQAEDDKNDTSSSYNYSPHHVPIDSASASTETILSQHRDVDLYGHRVGTTRNIEPLHVPSSKRRPSNFGNSTKSPMELESSPQTIKPNRFKKRNDKLKEKKESHHPHNRFGQILRLLSCRRTTDVIVPTSESSKDAMNRGQTQQNATTAHQNATTAHQNATTAQHNATTAQHNAQHNTTTHETSMYPPRESSSPDTIFYTAEDRLHRRESSTLDYLGALQDPQCASGTYRSAFTNDQSNQEISNIEMPPLYHNDQTKENLDAYVENLTTRLPNSARRASAPATLIVPKIQHLFPEKIQQGPTHFPTFSGQGGTPMLRHESIETSTTTGGIPLQSAGVISAALIAQMPPFAVDRPVAILQLGYTSPSPQHPQFIKDPQILLRAAGESPLFSVGTNSVIPTYQNSSISSVEIPMTTSPTTTTMTSPGFSYNSIPSTTQPKTQPQPSMIQPKTQPQPRRIPFPHMSMAFDRDNGYDHPKMLISPKPTQQSFNFNDVQPPMTQGQKSRFSFRTPRGTAAPVLKPVNGTLVQSNPSRRRHSLLGRLMSSSQTNESREISSRGINPNSNRVVRNNLNQYPAPRNSSASIMWNKVRDKIFKRRSLVRATIVPENEMIGSSIGQSKQLAVKPYTSSKLGVSTESYVNYGTTETNGQLHSISDGFSTNNIPNTNISGISHEPLMIEEGLHQETRDPDLTMRRIGTFCLNPSSGQVSDRLIATAIETSTGIVTENTYNNTYNMKPISNWITTQTDLDSTNIKSVLSTTVLLAMIKAYNERDEYELERLTRHLRKSNKGFNHRTSMSAFAMQHAVMQQQHLSSRAARKSQTSSIRSSRTGSDDTIASSFAAREASLSQLLRSRSDNQLALLQQHAISIVDHWGFDVFSVDRLSFGHSLLVVADVVFRRRRLLKRLHIDPAIFYSFVMAVEEKYSSFNPYHNSVHAADVLQTSHVLMSDPHFCDALDGHLDHISIFATLVGAMTHDIEHPGVTSNFLRDVSHPLAVEYDYSDILLERHHVAATFTLLHSSGQSISDPGYCDITVSLDTEQKQKFRQIVARTILSTALPTHYTFFQELDPVLELVKRSHMLTNNEAMILMRSIVKTADISNVAKPFRQAREWGRRITAEFFRQGDLERNLNLPLSAFSDRTQNTFATCQLTFIKYFASPLMDRMQIAVPVVAADFQSLLQSSIRFYNSMQESTSKALEVLHNVAEHESDS